MKLWTGVLCMALMTIIGCSVEKDDDGGGDSDEPSREGDATGDPGNDSGPPPDNYDGVYQKVSHTSTSFSCDGEPDEPFRTFEFFGLENTWETAPLGEVVQETDLWLLECSSAAQCDGQSANFFFPDKTDDGWKGITNLQVSDMTIEPGKCSVLFVERQAVLDGDTVVVTTSEYSDEVDPLGNGKCPNQDGADKTAQDYYEAYKGIAKCSEREVLTGKRVADLPE